MSLIAKVYYIFNLESIIAAKGKTCSGQTQVMCAAVIRGAISVWKESWGKVVLLTYRGTQMLLTTEREWN